MSQSLYTRRTMLKVGAALASAAMLPAGEFRKDDPQGAHETPALVVFFLNGGPSGLFNSAGSFLEKGSFGVRPDNVKALGNGLVVDAATFGNLPSIALSHMASINFQHGHYRHDLARAAVLQTGNRSNLLLLAGAMTTKAPIRCAIVNSLGFPVGISWDSPAEGGAAFTRVTDFRSVETELMRVPAFDHQEAAAAYGLAQGIREIADTPSTFLATEMLVRGGTSIVFSQPAYLGRPDRQFDIHKELNGATDRKIMSQLIPSLQIFLDRMLTLSNRNVVVALFGEFSRTVTTSDHEPGGTATIIGKHVRCGTAGPQNPDGSMPPNTPGTGALWAFLADALRLEDHPFGSNPNPGLLL
ncbi:DUF1501 domain-containing protein [Geothrix mesophila]|uniref:DUF1501 domain-containing protein n=1 Tax=Geothrix mesophila TaxID=2922723 RepID=UPI001FADDDD1|nr:DUF1501 domain-containing protein [Geothrix sp. SG198]